MKLGLVTYLWGQDWDLPTLLKNCEAAGVLGVELRTEHKHGVEPALSPAERREVRQRFADSPVTLVGYGSNAEYHSGDAAELHRNIELTKAYIQLMHDCGGSGVKVKPNSFVKNVPHQQTLEQIGKALNTVGAYAADFGQKIRLEVHGQGTDELPNIKAIMDVATHPNVGVCWNCNATDLQVPDLKPTSTSSAAAWATPSTCANCMSATIPIRSCWNCSCRSTSSAGSCSNAAPTHLIAWPPWPSRRTCLGTGWRRQAAGGRPEAEGGRRQAGGRRLQAGGEGGVPVQGLWAEDPSPLSASLGIIPRLVNVVGP